MIREFIFNKNINNYPEFFLTSVQTPSNIALVKYWGKKEHQIPANPSISFTLSRCYTKTKITFSKSEKHSIDLYFEKKKNEPFEKKVSNFISNIRNYCPYIENYNIKIETENSFPHSSGIASSASGMSALAVGIMNLEKKIHPNISKEYFIKKSSFLARLGSGSACRSICGNIMVWGETDLIKESSNLFAVNLDFDIHKKFEDFRDTILIIEKKEKKVSSSVGHSLMNNHPFAESRFIQANSNLSKIMEYLKNGDIDKFGEIVENEALTLHSMMMTSNPAFILMKPNTLEVINLIWEFRKKTKHPLYFTLDAGANIHLLYPKNIKKEVLELIKGKLKNFLCRWGVY